MLGDGHVRFGGRAGETDQPKGWHRAPARPNASGQYGWIEDAISAPITAALADLLVEGRTG